jgi:hypothetical protein
MPKQCTLKTKEMTWDGKNRYGTKFHGWEMFTGQTLTEAKSGERQLFREVNSGAAQ